MDAIATDRINKWREEECDWQLKLLQQPREEEKRNIRSLYSNYEADKNLNPDRVEGTCRWFLGHATFLAWRESRSSNILWLSADPGCGKSVLAKHLVDLKGELLNANAPTPTVCYFFFIGAEDNRVDAAKEMCAVLHQLFLQQPQLYTYAQEDFDTKGDKLFTDFDMFWREFMDAAADEFSSEIICVLDALDEC